jgi:hypothetical protein
MSEQRSGECNICSGVPYERNNYFTGKALSAPDLAAEQRYFNRTVLGWGVVCGLEVCVEGDCIVVHPGFALDCCGREILVCERQLLDPSRMAEALGIGPADKDDAIAWGLCLEYGECRSDPVVVPHSCGGHGGGREYNRIHDAYRLSIRHWKDVCPSDHGVECCAYATLGLGTSIHKAVQLRARTCPECRDCDCVLLANGTLARQAGQRPRIDLDPEHWKYRRVVYTNDTLARLIRCFHDALPHITGMSWKPGAHFDVDVFLDQLRQPLKITFDQPMNEASVTNPRTCRLTIFVDEGGCPSPLLIPVSAIRYDGRDAEYDFDEACIDNKLRASCQRLAKPADVELVLHGSMIRDKRGHALDAELIDTFPTGNGVQGGEFITYFTVGGSWAGDARSQRGDQNQGTRS